MFGTRRRAGRRITRPRLPVIACGLAVTGVLLASLAGTGGASARPAPAFLLTSVSSVSFSGPAGPNAGSPTIVITGTHLGNVPPAGTSDDATSCGSYPDNGESFTNQLYFTGDDDFLAGYSNVNTGKAACIGLTVQSWSPQTVVLQFGDAYGTFAHWYLSNGDGYALSIREVIYGGVVSGLT